MESVEVKTYTNATDSYGQTRKGESSSRNVQMALKVYSQTTVQDPRYIEATHVALTKDTSITTSDVIVHDGHKFNVLYVIPSQRFSTVILKKVD